MALPSEMGGSRRNTSTTRNTLGGAGTRNTYTPPAPVYTPPAPVYTPPPPRYIPPVYTPPAPVYTPPLPTSFASTPFNSPATPAKVS